MKRYYLTETLPENKNTKDLPPDIKQKLEAYKDAKREISNAAPKIRPYPLEVYEVEKDSQVREPTDGVNAPIINNNLLARRLPQISKLPQNVQARAKRLLTYLEHTNIGNMDIDNLLYDLTTKSKKIKSRPEELKSVIRQLRADIKLPSRYYVDKTASDDDDDELKPMTSTPHPKESGRPSRSEHRRMSSTSRHYTKQWV